MSTLVILSPPQSEELKTLSQAFDKKARLAGCSAVAASFLLIGALIVITCSCLCLTLPGVNVINHVILPAVVPGILAIIVSIPFILLAVKHNLDKNYYRETLVDRMVSHLESYKVPEMKRKERVKFILKNFLNWQIDHEAPNKLIKNREWSPQYQGKIVSDLKERIGTEKKKRNPRQEKIASILEKDVLEKVNQK